MINLIVNIQRCCSAFLERALIPIDNDPDCIPPVHAARRPPQAVPPQLAAGPGLSLPDLHPHLQGLAGFPIGSQMPNGTMVERSSQTAHSFHQRQLCVAASISSLPAVNFLFPCVSTHGPGWALPFAQGVTTGHTAAPNLVLGLSMAPSCRASQATRRECQVQPCPGCILASSSSSQSQSTNSTG